MPIDMSPIPMQVFLLFALSVAVWAGCCWIVAMARPWIRVTALVVATSLSSFLSFTFGTGLERGRFISSHLHWFAKYSAYLHQLADQHDCDKLIQIVTQFDQRFSPQPQDAQNLEDTMYEVFEMGPYRKPPR
jgi:hypothetical protein